METDTPFAMITGPRVIALIYALKRTLKKLN